MKQQDALVLGIYKSDAFCISATFCRIKNAWIGSFNSTKKSRNLVVRDIYILYHEPKCQTVQTVQLREMVLL